jgi:RHS repeat-associated protein
MRWVNVPSSAYLANQRISIPTVNVTEVGYIFVYLSYEDQSDNYVEFDDLKITHTKTNVIQYSDYYPFGMQTNSSWTRENSSNNYLYNAGSELNANSGLYETLFRGYDPVIGRLHQVDPLASAFHSLPRMVMHLTIGFYSMIRQVLIQPPLMLPVSMTHLRKGQEGQER